MMLLSAGLEGQRPGENIAAAAVCPLRKDFPTAWANSRIRSVAPILFRGQYTEFVFRSILIISCLMHWPPTVESADRRSGFLMLDYASLIQPTRLSPKSKGAGSRFYGLDDGASAGIFNIQPQRRATSQS